LRTHRIVALTLVTVAGLALSSCDGDDEPAAQPAPSSSEVSEPTSEPGAEPTEPGSEAPDDGATAGSAVERFEDFMHAYGSGDQATACEIGGDAIVAGVGNRFPCPRAFEIGYRFNPPKVLAALRVATVDEAGVVSDGPDRIQIPQSAISGNAELFTADDNSVVMVWDGSNWYVHP
jgi:hypothetical protein